MVTLGGCHGPETTNTSKKNTYSIIPTETDGYQKVTRECVCFHTLFLLSARTDLHGQMSQSRIWYWHWICPREGKHERGSLGKCFHFYICALTSFFLLASWLLRVNRLWGGFLIGNNSCELDLSEITQYSCGLVKPFLHIIAHISISMFRLCISTVTIK